MSWFGETNPHFWSRTQQAPTPPVSQPEPSQQVGRQSPDAIQPGRRIKPRERKDHVQPSPAHEPNPHFWERDQRQAPAPAPTQQLGHQQPRVGSDIQPGRRMGTQQPGQEPPLDIHPGRRTGGHQLGPEPPLDIHSRRRMGTQQPGDIQPGRRTGTQQPMGEIQPERRIRPGHQPEYTQPPIEIEPNPHFWPRDRNHTPVPTQQLQQPLSEIQPERIKPKEKPDHVQLPQSRPHTHEPELELIPTGYHPEQAWPTSQDNQTPLHPTEASIEHWPLHPNQGSQDESNQPHRQSKRHKPRIGSTKSRPPRKHATPATKPDNWQPSREQDLIYPYPDRTNPCTWFIAIFCVILWVVVILGGILILIIYLFYRPRNPHFEISNVSLNAAYLDMGYLLNADLVVLANFTNPNHKMRVDFDFIVLKLRYENQPIANQYINSFSAQKLESKLASVEMVSSQIRLPVLVTQQLVKQIRNNRITFEIEGYFHARSSFGSIFRYSYWMYSHCTIITTGPPSGIMLASNCITKR